MPSEQSAASIPSSDEIHDHLRSIRSLMERATVYQTLSAPAALVSGTLAILVGGGLVVSAGIKFWWHPSIPTFVLIWLGVLLVSSTLNLTLLARDARRRGVPVWSAGMKTALRAILPPLATCGLLGLALAHFEYLLEYCVFLWIAGYGLALLAAGHFAPVSIRRLGTAFVVAALACALLFHLSGGLGFLYDPVARASLFMAATFGGLHIIYAVLVGRSATGGSR